jgi:peroxiredoxin Q/BCP
MFRTFNSIALVFLAVASVTWGLSLQPPQSNTERGGTIPSRSGDGGVARRTFLGKGALTAASSSLALLVSSFPVAVPPALADILPQPGARAPDFELPNSRGNGLTTLEGLVKNGKWTVLYFYPGAFSSGCTLEARGFQRDLENYRSLNAQIVGVSVDPVEKNAQFCTEEKLDFFMLSDRAGLVSKKYGSALSVPGFGTFSNRQTYIIDPKGDLRWIFTDVESRIARHSSEVLEKLSELEMTG